MLKKVFSYETTFFLLIIIIGLLTYSLFPVYYPHQLAILDDGLLFALMAEFPTPDGWFHPHHLLLPYLIRPIWQMMGGNLEGLRAIVIMRWFSKLCMALTLGLVYLLARRFGSPRLRAVLISLFLLTGSSFWIFGTVAEAVAPSLALFLLVILLLFHRKKESAPLGLYALCGLIMGFNIDIYQMLVIYLPALWVGFWGFPKGKRFKPWLIFNGVVAITVAIPYFLVLFTVRHPANLYEVWDWLTLYAQTPYWGKGNLDNISISLQTLLFTQSYGASSWTSAFGDIFSSFMTILTMIMLIVGVVGWLFFRRNKINWQVDWGWVAAFTITALFFITWWCPDGWDYWLLPWALIILGLARIKFKTELLPVVLLSISIVLFSTYNYLFLIAPCRSEIESPLYRSAIITGKYLPQADSFYLSSINLWRHIAYWCNCERLQQDPDIIKQITRQESWFSLMADLKEIHDNSARKTIILDLTALDTVRELKWTEPDMEEWLQKNPELIATCGKGDQKVMIYKLSSTLPSINSTK